jgi:hypothetical protein
MDSNFLTSAWRRVVDYLKSKFEPGEAESPDESTSLLGKGWPGTDGGIAFPQVLEPALARIPRN